MTGRTLTNPRPTEQIATFKPLPWQIAPWRDQRGVLLLTGAAGGGKSRLAAEKLHGFCLRYPNATAMVLRKERTTLTNSTLPMLEREVIGDDPRVKHAITKHRYEYANGSTLVYGGMADEEQRENVRSMSLDIVWMEEATRFVEPDYNELLARMRGNAANWRQIVLTTNPDAPTHWIKRRLIDGLEAHVYMSAAVDNPYNPEQYAAALDSMTGIQRQRLLEGKWTQAEGVIYDNWSHENITLAADFNPDYGAVYWGVDDGYVYGGGPGTLSYHPRVILMAQITPVGGLNVFAEYYRTLELPEASISAAMGYGYPAPELAYVDSSAAELRARFSTLGIMNAGATHPVGEGIKNLRRFICDGNGQRLLKVHPRCENLIRELQTYRYSDSTAGVVAGEPKPEKLDDHGCLVAGTMIATGRGQVAIEDVRAGDRVMTSEGYFPVIAAGMTSASADLWEVGFSDGRTLRGTGNHPVYVEGAGYTELDTLRYGDVIRTGVRRSEVLPCPNQTRSKRGSVQDHALQNTVTVIGLKRLSNRSPVFNITVDAVHEYYANGVLVHNCDSARYLCWGLRHIEANV